MATPTDFYSDLPITFFVAHCDVKRWLDRLPHAPRHYNFILWQEDDDLLRPVDMGKLNAGGYRRYVTLQVVDRRHGFEIIASDKGGFDAIDRWHAQHGHHFPTAAQDIMELYYGRHRQTNSPHHGSTNRIASLGAGGAGNLGAAHIQAFNAALAAALAASFGSVLLTGDALKPKAPLKTSGIEAGEILGLRAWRLPSNDLRLHSLYMQDHVWAPGVPMIGDVGEDGYGRGVHAYKVDCPVARAMFDGYLAQYLAEDTLYISASLFVIGRVQLWGDVVQHEFGWRAQFAKIVSLDEVPSFVSFPNGTVAARNHPMLELLRAEYGVRAR